MKRSKAIINMVWYFFIQYIFFQVMFSLYAMQFTSYELAREALQSNGNIFYLFAANGIFGLMILIIFNFRYLRQKLSDAYDKRVRNIGYGFAGYYITFAVIIIFNILRMVFKLPESNPENEANVNELIKNVPLIASVLVVGFIIPLFEELIFRVSFMGILTKDKRVKSFLPYVLCAIAFTFLHDTSIITNFSVLAIMNFFSYFLLSLGLSLTYRLTDHSILAVFIVHACNNTFATIMSSIA